MVSLKELWNQIKEKDPENHMGLSWPIKKDEAEKAISEWNLSHSSATKWSEKKNEEENEEAVQSDSGREMEAIKKGQMPKGRRAIRYAARRME